jgi:hypothetical protein
MVPEIPKVQDLPQITTFGKTQVLDEEGDPIPPNNWVCIQNSCFSAFHIVSHIIQLNSNSFLYPGVSGGPA